MSKKRSSSFSSKFKNHPRIKKVCSHPNPLFEKWLKEWKTQAEESGSKMKYSFQNAIKSLKKYPLPLYSGNDCIVLANFGTKICALIDKKLEEHVRQFGPINWNDYIKVKGEVKVPAKVKRKRIKKPNSVINSDLNFDQHTKILEKDDRYVPSYRSGAYALLLALYEKSRLDDYKGFMTKQELIKSAQGLCNASFTIPLNESRYTAWSSMSTLIQKNLVIRNGNPSRYMLTNTGESLSCSLASKFLSSPVNSVPSNLQDYSSTTLSEPLKLKYDLCISSERSTSKGFKDSSSPFINSEETCVSNIGNNQIEKTSGTEVSILNLGLKLSNPRKSTCPISQVNKGTDVTATSSQAPNELSHRVTPLTHDDQSDILFSLFPRSFKIILNIDNTEVFGGSVTGQKNSKSIIKEYLEKSKIEFRVRNLNVGDFLWTCQQNSTDKEVDEVALPFIVERKRMDDLASSIRDGRFKEQKFRLKRSGLTQLIYLVEEYGSAQSVAPISTCEQAITNTQIIDDFKIKLVKDQKESAAYLAIMTRYFQDKFMSKTFHCVNMDSKFLSNLNHLNESQFYLMSFKELNSQSAKNRSLSIRDMFVKHLLQIFGASVNKVTSVIQKYPTPQALIKALESLPIESRDNLIRDIKCEKSGRMVDLTVSSQITKLYTCKTLL